MQHVRPRPIGGKLFFQRADDFALVFLVFHVNKINDDNSAEVAQANLPGDFFGRFEIRLDNRVFEVLFPDKFAGIHVNRHQRLGAVNHQIAAGLEPHFALQRFFQFRFDAVMVENRNILDKQADPVNQMRHGRLGEIKDFLIILVGINH